MKDSINFDRITFREDRLGAAPRTAEAPFGAASARTRRIPDAQRRLMQGGLATVSVLALAACKGSGTAPAGASVTPGSVTGSVVKGPIEGAFVFSDNDDDGAYDAGEAHDITDANGNFELADGVAAPGAPIIALLEGAVDTTSGHVYGAGETLSAPAGATVVTPFTTLMVEEGMTSDDIAAMIGVDPATFDADTFNPYAEGADPALAVAVENRAQQVAVVVEGFTAVLVGAGMDPAAADAAVMEAVGPQASEGNALHDQATIEAIADALIGSDATSDAVDAVLTALKADLVAAMMAVIAEIDSVDALSAGETTPAYQLLAELIAQAEAAAEAEAEAAGSGGDALTLAEDGAAADRAEAIATNHAPVLTLSAAAVTVTEATATLEILTASATDADNDTVTYSLIGVDADAFEIDADGKVTFREQPDYETQSSYRFTVLADDGTETAARQVTVAVTDVDPLMQLTIDADVLEAAATDYEVTAARVDDANDAFFAAPSDWSAALEGILFSSTDPVVSVSSAGITLEGETGALRMVFDSFSPSSIEALGQVIAQFENSQNIADLTISGGFRSIEVLDTDGDVLAAMSHTANGIEFYVGGMAAGDMDKLVLNGSFGNQIANYIDLWEAVEANPSGNGSALTLLDGLNEQIDATGVSMMAGNETLASVSLTTTGTAQNLSFSLGDHVFSITADGLPDLIAGMIDAAGGEEAFLDLAMAGFGVTSYEGAFNQTIDDVTVYRAEHRVEHTIFDTTEEKSVSYFTGTEFHFYHTYAQKDLVGGSHEEAHGAWVSEINSIAYGPASYWGGDEQLSRTEYDDLLESITGIKGYLDGFDGAINDLALGIDYSFDGDSAVSFDVERILDLIAAMEESGIGPDSPDRVAGEHTVDGTPVTELSDPGANWEVTLVGVGLDDLPIWQNGFLDSQAAAA